MRWPRIQARSDLTSHDHHGWQQARHSLLRSWQWCCNVQAVIWNGDDTDATTAAGIRVSLNPGQTTSIDSVENKSLTLKCGDDAETLALVDSNTRYASNLTK